MADYLQPYVDALATHGTGPGITLWEGEHSQTLRFEVLVDAMRTLKLLERDDLHLLDAGCSRGDLAAWLIERGVPFGRYTGVDGVPEVVGFAQARGLPRCDFVAGDFVARPDLLDTGAPDVILISGTLNSMDDATARRVVEAAWATGTRALVFNFLSDAADLPPLEPGDPARRLDTRAMLGWALSQTPRVLFRQDYFPRGHDATIAMARPRA